MSIMRDALLWASQNEFLKQHVPRRRFVKRALRQFMPGERVEDAIEAAQGLAGRGVASTFTALGENLTDSAQAGGVVAHYLDVYGQVASAGLDTEVSVKLTQLGLDLDTELAAANLDTLAAKAGETDNWLWIDIEASEYVDRTVELYRGAKARHAHVGLCLQAYLHRTPQDIEDLLPLQPGLRLVKGAYKEPASIALTSKADIDDAYAATSERLLAASSDGVRVALATHDVPLLDKVVGGYDRESYEIQMLYGIRTADQLRYAAAGHRMRTLIAYGEQWYPWYVRRLAERPANLWFVGRNLFSEAPPR